MYKQLPKIEPDAYYLLCTEDGHHPCKVLSYNHAQFTLAMYNTFNGSAGEVIVSQFNFAQAFVCRLYVYQVRRVWPDFYQAVKTWHDTGGFEGSKVQPDGQSNAGHREWG